MREALTPDSLAASVRMMRSTFKGAFLLVEGPSDQRFYRRFVDTQACNTVQCFNRDMTLRVSAILEAQGVLGVLAIVDADYARIRGMVPDSDHVVLTDSHDLETLLVKSNAFDKVLGHYATDEKLIAFIERTGKSVRDAILESGYLLGCFRLISLEQRLLLKFEGLSFDRFTDASTLSVNARVLVSEVKNKSSAHKVSTEALIEMLSLAQDAAHDPWEVSCGHDLVELLSVALRRTCATVKVDRVTLEGNLQLAFELGDWVSTVLCLKIRDWQRRNAPYRILPEDPPASVNGVA